MPGESHLVDLSSSCLGENHHGRRFVSKVRSTLASAGMRCQDISEHISELWRPGSWRGHLRTGDVGAGNSNAMVALVCVCVCVLGGGGGAITKKTFK